MDGAAKRRQFSANFCKMGGCTAWQLKVLGPVLVYTEVDFVNEVHLELYPVGSYITLQF